MTISILAKLNLTSWSQASRWAHARRYPCEKCVHYQPKGQCRFYPECKSDGQNNAIVFFWRVAGQKR